MKKIIVLFSIILLAFLPVFSDSAKCALKFDGVDDYLDCGTIGLNTAQNTIEFWIKPFTSSNDMRIIGGDNHSTDFHVSIQGQKIVTWPCGGWKAITSSVIPVSQWTHIAIVKNGMITFALEQSYQHMGTGAIITAAVTVDFLRRR